MRTQTEKTDKKKSKVTKPVQMSIWDILENPLFEKNLGEEMKLAEYYGKNYEQLKAKIEQDYRQSMATLDLAKDVQMKELLHDFSKPDDFTIKYVEVMTKKSRLARHKRDLIELFFAPIIKNTAIQIIKQKEEKSCKESSEGQDKA